MRFAREGLPFIGGATVLAAAVAVMVGLSRFRRRRLGAVAAAFKEDLRWLRRTLLEHD